MTTKSQHEKRNRLTEHEKNYKRYNTEVIDAYNALHPLSMSKLSMVIFNIIMDTKIHRQPNSRYYSKNEDKRIFNNKYITLDDILDRCHPVKYGVDGKAKANDLSNLMGRLQELDDNNIFYIWKYGKPFTYMFVMERDIGVWKYFNDQGCVTPKTLSKILALSSSMIDNMVKFEKKKSRSVKLKDIEISFVQDFLPHVISKMHKDAQKKLSSWDCHLEFSEYIEELKKELSVMDDYEGLTEGDSFYDRLPCHLKEKIIDNKTSSENMNINQLTADLVPKNENLVVSNSKPQRKKKSPVSSESREPTKATFQELNPFINCNQFMKYYREVVRLHNNRAKFYPVDTERIVATQIMDDLIYNGKQNDIDFLRSWIRYYISSYLNGSNVYKQDKTSLLNFKKTFPEYNSKYFRG